MKKIFIADIVESFGRAASGVGYGVGYGLKYAWDTTTGNKRLEKRGLKRNDFVGPGTAVGSTLGGALSFLAGSITYFVTRNNELATQVWLALWGTATAGSIVVAGQLSSIYKCSAHDRKQYLLERSREEAAAALPPPSAPPRKLT